MAVTISYISGGLFIVQIESEAPESAANQTTAAFKKPARVLAAHGVMIGAGAASDTVKLQRVDAAGSATDISDAVDVSAKADKAFFNFGTLDDAEMDLANGESLRIDTASDALARVTVLCAERQATP